MAISFLDLNAWLETAVSTYRMAACARDHSGLDAPESPRFRCRTFLAGSVFFAVGSFAFLLFTFNVNALDVERGPSGKGGIGDTATYFAENVAAALPLPSLHNLVFSRQFEVLALTFVLSLIAAVAVCWLPVVRAHAGTGRLRQLAFASLTVSLGLVHFGAACALTAVMVMLARLEGHELPSQAFVLGTVLVAALALVPVTTCLVHRWSGAPRMRTLGSVRSVALYSAIAPVLVMLNLMLVAGWVNERFKPELTIMTSGYCGQPARGTCVATFKPKDINGRIALQGVRITLQLGYQDEAGIVGPRRLAESVMSFDVVQTPDTPLPVQLTTDVAQGVTENVRFDCPAQFAHGSRRLQVYRHRAVAQTRLLEGPDFGNYGTVPVHFAFASEVYRLVRGHADGCSFSP